MKRLLLMGLSLIFLSFMVFVSWPVSNFPILASGNPIISIGTEFPDDWQYRIPIQITENSGSELVGYQVAVIVDTAALISAGKMKPDCGDIRFANSDSEEIPYWIEYGCNSDSTKIWVNVPLIPAWGIATILMYYGNPAATSASDGFSTFPVLFDDGELHISGENLSAGGWILISGYSAYQTYSNEYAANGSISLKLESGTPSCGWDNCEETARGDFAPQFAPQVENFAFDFYFYDDMDQDTFEQVRLNDTVLRMGVTAGSWTNELPGYYGGTERYYANGVSEIPRSPGWHQGSGTFWGGEMKLYIDEILAKTVTPSSGVSYIELRNGRKESSSYGVSYHDMIRIRKYVDPEPTAMVIEEVYTFDGFFSPLENAPTVNNAKAGQAIPVKWRLTDASGVPISDPWSFKSITSYAVNCGTFSGDPSDPVEEYSSGSSGLQYLGDGYWQFNWKTPKSYAGKCRVMVLALGDSTTHTANFTFK